MKGIPIITPIQTKIDLSILLPTYNEFHNISALINRIHEATKLYQKEIIVIDDNSPDRTWEIAQSIADHDVKVIRRTEDKGLSASLRCGVNEAKGDYLVWMDADQSMPPETIPALLDALKTNDIAVASRYIRGGKDLRPLLRKITSRMINLTANLILNFNVLDYTSGFITAKKEVFQTVQIPTSIYGEYCIAFLYHAKKKGFKIKEVPYSFIDRLEGESKTAGNIITLVGFGWIYFKRILKLRFGGE